MKKLKANVPVPPAPLLPGAKGTDRTVAQLAAATHKLSMRRVRDLLPGRIETRRLVLRAPIRGDVPDLARLANNATIAERLARLPHPYGTADAVNFIEVFAQRPDERPYAITLDGHFIGVVGFTFFADRPPELGYWLGEPHWGKGFMSEATRALVEAAHRTGQYQTIVARARADNAGSRRILEKLGFTPTGETVEEREGRGPTAIVHYELERPRWM